MRVARVTVLLMAWFAGCRHAQDTPAAPATPVNTAGTSPAPSASATQIPKHPAFDGERAMAQLKKQCDFGVRPLGSEAHEKLRGYLLAQMQKYADKTVTQEFTYRGMPVTNVIGIFYPEGADKPAEHPVLLLAHWDTRPIADGPFSSEVQPGKAPFRYGPHGWNRTTPIMGADDGASGVAVLLELARLFKAKKPPVGVLLLLDDGEDYGDFRSGDDGEGVELGSRYFAKHFRDNKAFGQPDYGILLDMVGAEDIIIPRESNSQRYAPGTNDKVFDLAGSLKYKDVFLSDETQEVGDDHIALNQAGIPTIDLIHPLPFNATYGNYETTGYRYWHTLQDTVDKCSAKSLKIVGETVKEVIYREIP